MRFPAGLLPSTGYTYKNDPGDLRYKQYKDVAILQDIFNHAAPSITLKYIGINDDVKDNTLKDFFYKTYRL